MPLAARITGRIADDVCAGDLEPRAHVCVPEDPDMQIVMTGNDLFEV